MRRKVEVGEARVKWSNMKMICKVVPGYGGRRSFAMCLHTKVQQASINFDLTDRTDGLEGSRNSRSSRKGIRKSSSTST